MSDVAANPVLAEVVRSGFVESRHRGTIVALAADGTFALTAGSANAPVFPRSSNKPLQAVAMIRAGLPLEGELLALAAASHSGEDFHVQGVHDILDFAGLTDDDLRCPPALPVDEPTARRLIAAAGSAEGGPRPESRVRNNCSGKHAAMLATCIANEWPTETYLDPEHPRRSALAEQRQESHGLARDVGARDLAEVGPADDDIDFLRCGLALRQSHAGDLRNRIHTARHQTAVGGRR